MIQRKETYVPMPNSTTEQLEWAEWAFQSHHWIEDPPGYYTCKLCGTRHTSMMGIFFDTARICQNNPIFLRQLSEK